MKITVVKHWDKWVVQIVQRNQMFHADFYDGGGTKEETLWMARMLRRALADHDAVVIEKYFKGDAR